MLTPHRGRVKDDVRFGSLGDALRLWLGVYEFTA